MATNTNINLLRRESSLPEYLGPVESQYKNFSVVVLFLVVIAGMITFGAYLTMQVRLKALEASKSKLMKQLAELKPRESKLMAVKSRIDVVDKILDKTKPVVQLLNTANTIALPPKLRTVAFEDLSKATVNYDPESLEDAAIITANVITQAGQKSISDPVLSSFTMSEDGINANFMFKPVWQ